VIELGDSIRLRVWLVGTRQHASIAADPDQSIKLLWVNEHEIEQIIAVKIGKVNYTSRGEFLPGGAPRVGFTFTGRWA